MDGAHLLRKLQIKPGARLKLIAAPAEIAAALGEGVALVDGETVCDAALAFCESPEDVRRHAGEAMKGLVEDGVLWFAYRKGEAAKRSGLSRDVGWSALGEAGYRGVRSIAFDDIWTGLRFRETSKVKAGA